MGFRNGSRRAPAVLLVVAVLVGCSSGPRADPVAGLPERIEVSSPAFADGDRLPARHTCAGADEIPPLRWSGVPAETAELVLLVEDPDAPRGTFTHWIAAGIDPSVTRVEGGRAPEGAREGRNGFGAVGWGAPCPPEGDEPHRYRFTVVAAGAPLDLPAEPSISEVRAALAEHGIARGTLTGLFAR